MVPKKLRNTAIFMLREGGATFKEIGETYGISAARVSAIYKTEKRKVAAKYAKMQPQAPDFRELRKRKEKEEVGKFVQLDVIADEQWIVPVTQVAMKARHRHPSGHAGTVVAQDCYGNKKRFTVEFNGEAPKIIKVRQEGYIFKVQEKHTTDNVVNLLYTY